MRMVKGWWRGWIAPALLVAGSVACGGGGAAQPTATAAGDPGQRLESLAITSASGECPGGGSGASQECDFTVEWTLAYTAESAMALNCRLEDVGDQDFTHNFGQSFPAGSSTWVYAAQVDGEYPGPGQYEEQLVCQMLVPGVGGEVVSQLGATVSVDLLAASE